MIQRKCLQCDHAESNHLHGVCRICARWERKGLGFVFTNHEPVYANFSPGHPFMEDTPENRNLREKHFRDVMNDAFG